MPLVRVRKFPASTRSLRTRRRRKVRQRAQTFDLGRADARTHCLSAVNCDLEPEWRTFSGERDFGLQEKPASGSSTPPGTSPTTSRKRRASSGTSRGAKTAKQDSNDDRNDSGSRTTCDACGRVLKTIAALKSHVRWYVFPRKLMRGAKKCCVCSSGLSLHLPLLSLAN